MKKLIECVPNFSEGRNMSIIKQITDAIESVEGIQLLDVDPGKATNRTVVTFVGEPDAVCEAAFRGMQMAHKLIDMSKHHGEHPRFGATDVCPLVPVSNISMEEVIPYAHALAKRVGEELDYPVYCYESACLLPERKNLAYVRSGEYEALPEKLKQDVHRPDFGPAEFRPKQGATAIGARDFLIAVNFNLNTTSVRRTNSVAFDVREAGRPKRIGNPITGAIEKDANGEPVRIPGTCKGTKAIGWYIEEYGIAQVSMNITDIKATPLHIAFEEVSKSALARGMRVTGTELVGLVPLSVLTEAGAYFLEKQSWSRGVSESELIKIAVKSMGLDDLKPFDPQKNIIEYLIQDPNDEKLISMSLKAFSSETASDSPAPGGGSISAYVGSLGIALGTMVANLSAHKQGWDDRLDEFSSWATKGQELMKKLNFFVDEDTRSFNGIMDALKLPKDSAEEKTIRKKALLEATRYAIQVPFEVMKTCLEAFPLLEDMAKNGNPNSVSDAGVGALCLRTAIRGAYLNVKINSKDFSDTSFVENILKECSIILHKSEQFESLIMKEVERIIAE